MPLTCQGKCTIKQCDCKFFTCDIFSYDIILSEKADIIVSNPPYVRDSEKQLMNKNVLDFEPHTALFVPDDDPLIFYKAILKMADGNTCKRRQLIF